jgi:gluconolactonase
MNRKIKAFVYTILFILPGLSFSPENDQDYPAPVAPGAILEKLAGGFLFTEGPASDAKGNVYFTDQPNNRILVWTTDGKLSTFMEASGRSNGLYIDRKGYIWACADEKNELWQIAQDKKVKVILGQFMGKPFNGPNDLWITGKGGVYFTDPYYQRSWWDHKTMPQESQCVYFLRPDHKTIIKVADDLVKPNGIIGTPDGKMLYVADIGGKKTWSYSIGRDGNLSNKKLFCEMGSDGMTLDEKGNLYLTGNGVTIFDKSGKRIGNIAVPEKWTANVCFGDPDSKSLFITASNGLYRIRMMVKGADR